MSKHTEIACDYCGKGLYDPEILASGEGATCGDLGVGSGFYAYHLTCKAAADMAMARRSADRGAHRRLCHLPGCDWEPLRAVGRTREDDDE